MKSRNCNLIQSFNNDNIENQQCMIKHCEQHWSLINNLLELLVVKYTLKFSVSADERQINCPEIRTPVPNELNTKIII